MTTLDKITTSVIACQVALNLLEELKHTPHHRGLLKNRINLVVPELIKSESKYFDEFFSAHDKSTDEVYAVYFNFLKEMSKVPIYDCGNIIAMYAAAKKDPKSMKGIVNKILKQTHYGSR